METQQNEAFLDRHMAAFNQLYLTCRQPMYQAAYSILHSEDLAEDAVQDSFCQLLKHLHQINEADSQEMKQQLLSITKSTAMSMLHLASEPSIS